jgi:hypothetical protein
MSDPLTDLITDIQDNGIRWVSIVTILALYRKERRNHLLNKRDAALFHNQRIIMQKLEVADQWKDGPRLGLQPMDLPNYKQLLILFCKETLKKKSNYPRRKNMIANILKANLSKKLISALVSIGIATLNSKYGWNIPEELIWGILGLSATHISLQTIIDSIKANATTTVKTVVMQNLPDIQNAISKVIADPGTSYSQMVPYITDVHSELTGLYESLKSGRVTDATREAMNTYLTIHAYLQAVKSPVTPSKSIGA